MAKRKNKLPSAFRRISRSTHSQAVSFVDARRLRPRQTPLAQAVRQHEIDDGQNASDLAEQAQHIADQHQHHVHAIWISLFLLFLAFCIAALAIFFFSPAFRVSATSIHISPTGPYVDRARVQKAVAPAIGHSLARVDTASLERSISHVEAVGSVHVTKKLPNALLVKVVPLVPKALLHDARNQYALVDGSGRVVARPRGKVAGVPLIEVSDALEGTDQPVLQQTLAVLGALPSSLSSRMAKVSAPTRDSVTTVTDDGYTVIWGDSHDMKLKIAIVEHLLGTSQMGSNRTIDVTSPARPVLRQ